LAGVSVTGPVAVGVMSKVCAAAELLKVRTIGTLNPPPAGVMVMAPVYTESGVTVKSVERTPIAPLFGPVNVKLSAGATGVTEFEADDAALVP
jgi:hypothetical protein